MKLTGIRWLVVVVLGLSLWIMAGPALEIGNANAESNQGRGLDLLSRAAKSYEAGAYTDAAELIDSAFKAGLTGELAARAILLRAEINERTGASAKALQDYSNALWMEALPPSDRKKASDGKDRVLASMGLTSAGAPGTSWQASTAAGSAAASSSSGVSGFFGGVFSGADNTPAPPRPAEQAQQTSRQASMSPEPASAPAAQSGSSSSGVLGFFSGVFGGSESTAAPPRPAQAEQSTQPAEPAAAQPAPTQKTPSPAPAKPVKVAHAKPASGAAPASAQPASALSVASAAGEVLIVFGSASSEASCRSTAKNIKAQLADILIHRDLDVTPRANGGFQIQAGPYKAKSSAVALCSAIKQRGIQCQVTP